MSAILGRTRERILTGERLRITVFGSSTTEGYGASDPATTGYPPRMSARLAPHIPGGIMLSNRGVSGEDIDGMARRLDDVVADRPDLVVWQAGSNDGPRGVALPHFETLMRAGIARIVRTGADLILMEPQYCTVLEANSAFAGFLDSVRGLGEHEGVPVFPRYALMRRWSVETGLGCEGLSPDGMHMADLGYRLLGEAVAAFIVEAVGRPA